MEAHGSRVVPRYNQPQSHKDLEMLWLDSARLTTPTCLGCGTVLETTNELNHRICKDCWYKNK